jgi:flagellar biosynthesis protein FliR
MGRYDTVFLGMMVVVLMALPIWAVGYPANIVFGVAILLGTGYAIVRHMLGKRTHGSTR